MKQINMLEKGKLLLVYECLPNGTLNDWLYKYGSQEALFLKMKHFILEGVGATLYQKKTLLKSIEST